MSCFLLIKYCFVLIIVLILVWFADIIRNSYGSMQIVDKGLYYEREKDCR